MIKKIAFLIGFLFLLFFAYLFGREYRGRDKSKVIEAEIVLDRIVIELEKFYFVCGRYPSQEEGLLILTKSACGHEFTLRVTNLKDPWGTEIAYQPKTKSFTILSLGADHKSGGTGYDEDIVAPGRLKLSLEK